jgi:AcrR family transcriptional regulator
MSTRPKPTRLTREESQAQTRARLIAAARAEIARQGAAASVRDIAEAAGYTQGALYAHFESKEFLLLELLRLHMEGEIAALGGLLQQGGQVKGGVRAALDHWLSNLNTDQDWALFAVELQMLARRDVSFAKQYDKLFAAHVAAMGALVERLFVDVGAKLPAPASDVSAMLIALAHGMALQRRPTKRGAPDPAGAMIKLVLDRILAGVA